MKTQTTIATKAGASYIGKLCRHFVHKIDASYEGNTGKAIFPFGVCLMRADDESLTFEVDAHDAEGAAKIKGALDRHLIKFAYKEQLEINWEDLG